MIEQLKTIREALVLGIKAINHLGGAREAMPLHDAMPALDQLEAMVGEPVATVTSETGNPDISMSWWHEPALPVGTKLYAAPVAQQPQAEHDLKDVRCECCGYMTHHREHMGCIRAASKQPQAKAVWVNPELEHMAEEAECVSMCLNDRGVPSKDGSKPLSLWGRVQQYANPRFLGGMTTNTPIVSSEHIKSLAQVCRLIGNYTTTEFVQNVVGFAQVLLANKAVQEAFVKANTHLLYAAPQQAEAAPSSDLNPDEGDPVTLWAEIWRLREAVKGPDGYATWQDAATAERIRRVRAESKQAEEAKAVPTHDDTDLIEQMLEALRSCSGVPHWPALVPTINAARKRLETPQQAEAVPPGYVLVPVEPTEAMLRRGAPENSPYGINYAEACYRAMIAAAIAQQKGGA